MTHGDDDSWHEEVKSIKPLKGRKKIVTSEIVVKKPVIRTRAVPVYEVEQKTTASPLPQKRVKQLRQQKIPVESTLDLHGMTLDKAYSVVKSFIATAHKNQLRCIEIITGKGSVDRGTGHLKRHFPMWLQEAGIKNMILHLEENPNSRGGSYLILLRRIRSRSN